MDFVDLARELDWECADLRGATLPSDRWDVPLENVNMKGADLSRAYMRFKAVVDADLRGTRLGTFDGSYAFVHGRIDPFTQLPEFGCTPEGDSISCTF